MNNYNENYNHSYFENRSSDSFGQADGRGAARFASRTYAVMVLGVLLTFAVALFVSLFMPSAALSPALVTVVVIAELVTVIVFSARMHKASYGAQIGMFVFYSALTGFSISYIFLLFEMRSIFLSFAAAALAFAIMAIMGHTTQRDLSPMGRVILPGLIALLVLSVVSWFVTNSVFDVVICCLGLILFLGITAFDAQRMQKVYEQVSGDVEAEKKYSVVCALNLYLDFINIFLYLIRLLGRVRRD